MVIKNLETSSPMKGQMKIKRSTIALIAVIAIAVVVAAVLLWPARKFETAIVLQETASNR